MDTRATPSPVHENDSLFEQLPPELREIIYSYALVPENLNIYGPLLGDPNIPEFCRKVGPPKAFTLSKRKDCSLPVTFLGREGAAILRANHIIYKEALPLLYGKNTFNFTQVAVIRRFISLPSSEHIRHVIISDRERCYLGLAMRALRSLPHLRSLTVQIFKDDVNIRKPPGYAWNQIQGVVYAVGQYIDRFAADHQAQIDKISFMVSGGPWARDDKHHLSSEEVSGRFKAEFERLAEVLCQGRER